MSGLSFRPRPIDINKQMPIIREENVGEDIGVFRSVPKIATGMEPEDEEVSFVSLYFFLP